jgi:hypothetical protein
MGAGDPRAAFCVVARPQPFARAIRLQLGCRCVILQPMELAQFHSSRPRVELGSICWFSLPLCYPQALYSPEPNQRNPYIAMICCLLLVSVAHVHPTCVT